jgi:hypothetical protein
MNKYLSILCVLFLAGCGSDDSNPENEIGNARLSWPSDFMFIQGPIDPDLSTFDYQSLMTIESETNNITCRVVVKPSDMDIGAIAAFSELEVVTSNIIFTSITDIEVMFGMAQEAVAVITDTDGTMRSSVNRWYYFPASNIAGDLSFIYSIGCSLPMVDNPENQSIISTLLNSVRWEFR